MSSQDKDMNSLDREAAVSFLNKELDETPNKTTNRISIIKRTLCISLVLLTILAFIGCLSIFICVADVTRPLRCSASSLLSLDLKECRPKGVLDSLAIAPSSDSFHTNTTTFNVTKYKAPCNVTDNAFQNCSNTVKTLSRRDLEYIKEAEISWNVAWELLNDKEGWTLEKGRNLKSGKVYYKEYEDFGKVNKLEGYVDISAEGLFQVLIADAVDYPTWNPIIAQAYVVENITENIDVCYMQTNPILGGLISSREYLNIRIWKTVEGVIMSSGAGTEHPDQPETDEFVRAYNRPGGMLFRPVEGNPNKCILEWTLSADFGGWVPSWAVDSGVPSSMIDFLNDARSRVKHLQDTA